MCSWKPKAAMPEAAVRLRSCTRQGLRGFISASSASLPLENPETDVVPVVVKSKPEGLAGMHSNICTAWGDRWTGAPYRSLCAP